MEGQTQDQQEEQEEQEEQQEQQEQQESALPPDFAQRIATKVIFTNERERDQEVALKNIGSMLMRTVSQPDRIPYFIEALESLENDDETTRFAGLCWASLVLDRQEDLKYEQFVEDILQHLIVEHQRGDKPPFEMEYRRKRYSYYARILGESFISMMNINSDLYEAVSEVFSSLIRREMEMEERKKDEEKGSQRRISLSKGSDDESKIGKKLFDDVVDFIHARGEQKTGTLHQGNPNEFIAVLADRMRGTRRYVIQDLLNRQALTRRKETEKELSAKLASAEDIILAKAAYKKAVSLYWTEKQYNFKFLAVEKVRVTVQVLAVLMGVVHFLFGYLGWFGMKWWEGVIITISMYFFSKILCSRKFFSRFFPEDVSKELEMTVGTFTPTFRKMSLEQMDAFLSRQVKDPDNKPFLIMFPEFMKYVFAVMPDRNNVVLEKEELSEVLQNAEMDIARVLRANPELLEKWK